MRWEKEIKTTLECFSFLLFLPLDIGSFIFFLENAAMLIGPKISLKGDQSKKT